MASVALSHAESGDELMLIVRHSEHVARFDQPAPPTICSATLPYESLRLAMQTQWNQKAPAYVGNADWSEEFMRILWTLLKVVVGIAIAIPVGILALALTVGVVGTLMGLVALAVKLAVFGLIGYGAYRVGRAMFGRSPKASAVPIRELPPVDPYYQAAMRELDSELGPVSRS
jgi:hypothetical protein